MKYLLCLAVLLGCLYGSGPAAAWDGFDADSADLVEVTPDRVPRKGDTVDVRNYDKDATETCLVESVTRNARTVELVVRAASGTRHTLVMEGR
ncbi:MAG: DUF5334 family protein [Desulfovibrio sp.]|jgi:hypothetical protein|uniref:DUF5334 family protein n=1 Tax=uncultured Desulfovibrio sp. TaxID=167968 RepID=UPI001B1A14B7|nr:DUF5334 family protein [uncultured Desulfovibrio sp.]MBE6442351.1 hypothetical protein [Desulfovibrio desulfuricans]MBO5491570.1 DUF5334 family protein [Desulfovibrio sp.]MBO6171420.1 DUF5334 family protein [Desulfovibrio sp.]